MPPALLVRVIFPPLPVPLEYDTMAPVLISPEAFRVREPPFPSLEEESSLPPAVSMPPALLVRVIFPPVPVPLEFDDMMLPVLIFPEAVRVTEPPFP